MTQISSKLAALAVALMMNSAILGGVALLFSTQSQHPAAAVAALAMPEIARAG